MPTDLRAVVVIPARWASHRLPGKPLIDIAGKPMIEWVVRQAEKSSVQEVLVATDDKRIFNAVNGFGGRAVMTSPEHPSGTDRVAEAMADLSCDVVVNVQGDEPMIPPEHIDSIVDAFKSGGEEPVVTLMTPIKSVEAMFDPHITKVVSGPDGRALYFSKAPIPYHRVAWPTGKPESGGTEKLYGYKHLGIYGFRRDFLMRYKSLPPSRLEAVEKLEQLRILENNFSIRVIETCHDSIGVDTEEDRLRAEEALQAGSDRN